MADGALGIRLATEEEIMAERAANSIDMWYQESLDMDERSVARAATRLWDPPVSGGTEGESLWKLWSEELGVPAYIAVGVLPPAAIFSNGMCPDDDECERLRDEIRRMLLEADQAGGCSVG